MILDIVNSNDSILSQRASDFNFADQLSDAKKLFEDLRDTMVKHRGLGLAAPQCGLPYRAFVLGHPDRPEEISGIFNPTIVNKSDEMVVLEEGCISFHNLFIKIKRPESIRVRFAGYDGNIITNQFSGMTARIIQHEIDHLDGIVFKQRAFPMWLEKGYKLKKKLDRKK